MLNTTIKTYVSNFLYKHIWRYRFVVDNNNDKRQFSKVYDKTPSDPIFNNDCILMFSGKAKLWAFDIHGGFADRLKGMVSVYKACKTCGRNFKILHTYPYRLEKYLEPADIDWRINEQSVKYNINAVRPYYLRHSPKIKDEAEYSHWRLLRLLKSKYCLHIYSNTQTVTENEFRQYFRELFKPSHILQEELDRNLCQLGNAYISLSYRFTHLLGDPVDTYMPELTNEEKEKLIIKTLESIKRFHQLYPSHRILVNSDSNTFLSRVKALDENFIYITPGVPVHIDQDPNASDSSYMKTFVDFFMIGNAEKVFLIRCGKMRNSGFPKCAATVGDKSFETVWIK